VTRATFTSPKRDEVAGGDVDAFRRNLEAWFDDTMARVSGWYKRKAQWILAVLGVIIAIGLNANTLTMGERLWKDPAVRNAVVGQATRDGLHAVFGWLLTIAAISLGAPFWFDTLSRLARLRGTGKPEAPLPTSGRGQPNERNVTQTPTVNVTLQPATNDS